MSVKLFEVDNIQICEFASQDQSGKQILIGVNDPEVLFEHQPQMLPAMFIVMSIQPLATDTDIQVELTGPGGMGIIRGKFHLSLDSPVNPMFRMNLNFGVPALPFPGFGEYKVVVRDARDKAVSTKKYRFKLNDGAPRIQARVVGSAEINREFIRMAQSLDPFHADLHVS